jgi:hypothetical protein
LAGWSQSGEGQNQMSVEYLKALLAMAEEMLATTSRLPSGPDRNEAVQMLRRYISDIALLMNAIEIGLKARK